MRAPEPHKKARFGVASVSASLVLVLATGCNDSNNGDGTGTAATIGTDSGGTDSGGTDSSTDGDTDSGGVEVIPLPGGMRRLLAHEYTRSIELMLGSQAAAAATPPPDIPQEGFDAVGASILSLAADAIEQYESSAKSIADAAITNPAKLASWVPCVTQAQEDACYQAIATDLGRIAFRRSPTADEIARLTNIAIAARAWGDNDFMVGVKYELMAILQSPSFLHVVEVGVPDTDSGYRKLTPIELVSRMAFTLLGRTPEPELLDMAEAGELDDDSGISAAAQAMVARAEAVDAIDTFFDELLRLRLLETTPKSAMLFPTFNQDLAAHMRTESLLLVRDVVWNRDVDFRNIYAAPYTFINDALATHYGLPPPGMGAQFVKATWPDGQGRGGYLSQASFLTYQSGPLRNSPTKRGRYVQVTLRCVDVPPPPGDVDVNLPPPMEGQTLRELLEMHMTETACKGCHGLMDPVGFAFEAYDAIGAYRPLDNGSPVNTSGNVAGFGMWANAAELGQLLATDKRTADCLIKNVFRGRLGSQPTNANEGGFDLLENDFGAREYRLKSFLVDMTTSRLFRLVDEPK